MTQLHDNNKTHFAYNYMYKMYLIFMTRTLTIFRQSDQCLCDEFHVVGMDVETQQHQPSGGYSTHTVKELERLQDEVVTVLAVLLFAEVVL